MNSQSLFCALVTVVALGASPGATSAGPATERIPPIAPGDLDRLMAEVKPERGESPWREIPWVTNITEARRRSVAEDKPLVIFTAADGSPLGRT